MSLIEYVRYDGDDYLTEKDYRWSEGEFATEKGGISYRRINLSLDDGQVINDGTGTETVTISVVNGLEIARGTDPENASVLDYDGDATVSVDGVETAKTLSNGTVSFDLTTDKPADSTITVTAESLADHPAESDSVEIEVVSA